MSFTRLEASWGRPGDDDRLQADVAAGTTSATSFMTSHLQARTLFMDEVVVGAIEGAVGQIVIAGAGYDGRSLRYAGRGVRWYEIDHPSTQSDKLTRLARLGIDVSHVRYAGADFAEDDVAAALAGLGQRTDQATLFLCEGVAAYLERPTLESLLGALARRAAPGSTLAITLSVQAPDPAARARREALAAAVARMGEPMSPPLPRHEVEPLLSRTGWELSERRTSGGRIIALRASDQPTDPVFPQPSPPWDTSQGRSNP